MEQVESLLVNKCIEKYENVHSDSELYPAMGPCPDELFILESVKRINKLNSMETPEKKWLYKDGELCRHNGIVKAQFIPRQAFNSIVEGSFYIDRESGKAFLDIIFGPRFATGYQYDLSDRDGVYSLENEKLLWAS